MKLAETKPSVKPSIAHAQTCLLLSSALFLSLSTGCAGESEEEPREDDIRIGLSAREHHASVGTLDAVVNGEVFARSCTATVVGPRAILTAAHCIKFEKRVSAGGTWTMLNFSTYKGDAKLGNIDVRVCVPLLVGVTASVALNEASADLAVCETRTADLTKEPYNLVPMPLWNGPLPAATSTTHIYGTGRTGQTCENSNPSGIRFVATKQVRWAASWKAKGPTLIFPEGTSPACHGDSGGPWAVGGKLDDTAAGLGKIVAVTSSGNDTEVSVAHVTQENNTRTPHAVGGAYHWVRQAIAAATGAADPSKTGTGGLDDWRYDPAK